MTLLYQTAAVKALENTVFSEGLQDQSSLMKQAGCSAFIALQDLWPDANDIIVCCGKGNNAGDGFVLAHAAFKAGLSVTIYTLSDPDLLVGAAYDAAEQCRIDQIPHYNYQHDTCFQADVIVDALLGTGLDRDVTGDYAFIIKDINAAASPVLSLDIPSGLNADSGEILGCAVEADVTMTFIAKKPGLYTAKGPAYCGRILLNQLNIPDALLASIEPTAALMSFDKVDGLLSPRKKDAHKGHFGHVLVVGGDYGMGGAVRMTAEAALRAGAGLVTVATRPEHVMVVSGSRPEVMCHQVATAEDLMPLAERASVIVIGPGLGTSDWSKALLAYIVTLSQPMVIDADALNLLAQEPMQRAHWILTPHPGEASRLLNETVQAVQNNRFKAAAALQQQYGGVAILKGVGTIVQTSEKKSMVCTGGNPGMATAGMGDILSGVLGGLLAQGLTVSQAAEVGVMVHALAADQAVMGDGERGLLATDLLPHIRMLVNPDAS